MIYNDGYDAVDEERDEASDVLSRIKKDSEEYVEDSDEASQYMDENSPDLVMTSNLLSETGSEDDGEDSDEDGGAPLVMTTSIESDDDQDEGNGNEVPGILSSVEADDGPGPNLGDGLSYTKLMTYTNSSVASPPSPTDWPIGSEGGWSPSPIYSPADYYEDEEVWTSDLITSSTGNSDGDYNEEKYDGFANPLPYVSIFSMGMGGVPHIRPGTSLRGTFVGGRYIVALVAAEGGDTDTATSTARGASGASTPAGDSIQDDAPRQLPSLSGRDGSGHDEAIGHDGDDDGTGAAQALETNGENESENRGCGRVDGEVGGAKREDKNKGKNAGRSWREALPQRPDVDDRVMSAISACLR